MLFFSTLVLLYLLLNVRGAYGLFRYHCTINFVSFWQRGNTWAAQAWNNEQRIRSYIHEPP